MNIILKKLHSKVLSHCFFHFIFFLNIKFFYWSHFWENNSYHRILSLSSLWRVWTGFEQGLNRVWTGFEQGLNRVWTGFEQGLNRVWTEFEQSLNRVFKGAYWETLKIWFLKWQPTRPHGTYSALLSVIIVITVCVIYLCDLISPEATLVSIFFSWDCPL